MKLIRRESDCSYIYDAATGSEVFLLFFLWSARLKPAEETAKCERTGKNK